MDINLREDIAKTAYGLYENKGMIHGHDLDDWLQAERVVAERYSNERQNKRGSLSNRRRKVSNRGDGRED